MDYYLGVQELSKLKRITTHKFNETINNNILFKFSGSIDIISENL